MEFVIQIVVLIIAVVFHEVAHGYAAFLLGDPTAKYAGRLTLNPVKHLDLWGSFLIPLLLIVSNAGVILGWAKPVPFNPYNLKSQKYGPLIVGMAGPLANLVLALLAGLGMRILLITGNSEMALFSFLEIAALINILLLVFNLLPIPPLDGSKVLFAILPLSEQTKMALERYGLAILLAFLFIFGRFVHWLVNLVWGIFSEYVVYFNIS